MKGRICILVFIVPFPKLPLRLGRRTLGVFQKHILINLIGFSDVSYCIVQRQIALTHGPDGVKPQTTRTDDSGSFCFEVSVEVILLQE